LCCQVGSSSFLQATQVSNKKGQRGELGKQGSKLSTSHATHEIKMEHEYGETGVHSTAISRE
jgi:hypothetical protein